MSRTESRRRWEDYTRAKEIMLERSHIPEARWWVVQAVDKKRARLNCISHVLKSIPYKRLKPDKVKLPKRSQKGRYNDQASLRGMKFVAERY